MVSESPTIRDLELCLAATSVLQKPKERTVVRGCSATKRRRLDHELGQNALTELACRSVCRNLD